MNDTKQIAGRAGRVIDDAMSGVLWCRDHLEGRAAGEKLWRLQISLASLALAIEYEMEGEREKAVNALDHAAWSFERRPSPRQE